MIKLHYLYSANRKFRIHKNEYSDDFLYGYQLFEKNKNFHVTFSEIPIKNKISYLYLKSIIYARLFNIGFAEHKLIHLIDKIKEQDFIICTNDSIALGMSYLKKRFGLNCKLIYLNMGMGDRLYQIKSNSLLRFLFKSILKKRLKQINIVISLGIIERDFLQKSFPSFKFIYCSFGIDTNFWKYKPYELENKQYVTFIGNDLNRDFKLLEKVIADNPHQKFLVISNKKINIKTKNLVLIDGHLNNSLSMNDKNLINIYHSSKFIIIPLKDCIQPSGQSVMLQAMSCGAPVLISESNGLFSPILKNNFNCIVSKNNKDFMKQFNLLTSNFYDLPKIAHQAHLDCLEYFNKFVFFKSLKEIIAKL